MVREVVGGGQELLTGTFSPIKRFRALLPLQYTANHEESSASKTLRQSELSGKKNEKKQKQNVFLYSFPFFFFLTYRNVSLRLFLGDVDPIYIYIYMSKNEGKQL